MPNPEEAFHPELKLYEKRKGVYPKAVDGKFRRLKWVIMAVTLAIYYITPWIGSLHPFGNLFCPFP